MNGASVEEVAGEKDPGHKDHEKPQIQTGSVEFNRKIVGIGIAFHKQKSATNELHRGESAEKEHRRNSEGVKSKPANRENRVDAWRRGDGSLCHGLTSGVHRARICLHNAD